MTQRILKEPPKLSGTLPFLGHIHRFGRNPHAFMMQLQQKLGDVVEFKLFHQSMVLLTGRNASEAFNTRRSTGHQMRLSIRGRPTRS